MAAVVVLVGGGGATPTVPVAARLALASATLPAPAVNPGESEDLKLSAAGIPFPAWGPKPAGPRAAPAPTRWTGARITTVFYMGRRGDRIGYAITDGAPLSGVHGSTVAATACASRSSSPARRSSSAGCAPATRA